MGECDGPVRFGSYDSEEVPGLGERENLDLVPGGHDAAGEGLADPADVLGIETEGFQRRNEHGLGERHRRGGHVDPTVQAHAGILPGHSVHLQEVPAVELVRSRHHARVRDARAENGDPAAGHRAEPAHVRGRDPDGPGVDVLQQGLARPQRDTPLSRRVFSHGSRT